MDAQQYLVELGYTAEEAATQLTDARFKKSIETAIQAREEGIAAREQAAKDKAELDKWWKETAQPSLLNGDGNAAAAKAEAARLKTFMQTFVDQGYPVPDEIKSALKGTEPVTTTTPATATTPAHLDPQKAAMEMAQATARLHDLSVEYQELYGTPLSNTYGLLEEARSQNKPLTDYVRSKFNFDGKRSEIAEKKINDRIAAAVKEKEEQLAAKFAERANPNLAPAVVSRAVQVAEANKEHADSWKTKVGRNEAKRDRLLSFRNVDTKIA